MSEEIFRMDLISVIIFVYYKKTSENVFKLLLIK